MKGLTQFARRDRVRRLKERLDQPMSWRQVRWTFRSLYWFVPSLITIGVFGWNFILLVPLVTCFIAGRMDHAIQMEQDEEEKGGTKRSSSL